MNLRQSWGLLVGFVVGGAIVYSGDCALGQSRITPDQTLGTNSSIVVPNYLGLPVEEITGGAVQGGNLFHSFLEFNVSAGRGAYFLSPNAGIQNILARVTGQNPSEILGTLGTFGNSNPNLFLINPNGIIFGPNASLNVGGSFVATTANAVQLGDKGLFSASEPATSNLLSINPSAFFFNSLSHGAITNSSRATSTVLGVRTSGLQVPDGQSLLLIGGDINLDGGYLAALGGRIELGGLAGTGTVKLPVNGNNLTFPSNVARSNVMLTNGAFVDVTGDKGSIAITTQNLDILGGSGLQAGIGVGGTADSKAGNIEIDAQEAVNLKDGSLILNTVQSGAAGKSGDVRINTGSLSLTNGAQVSASTFGQGNAGNVIINARNAVSLAGGGTTIFDNIEREGVGNSGGISIKAGSLSLTDGAQLQSGIRGASATLPGGRGNAGNVNIDVRDAITLTGTASNGLASAIFGDVESGAIGKGGDINITARSLYLTDGARLITSTSGQGNAGSISVQVLNAVSLADSGTDIFSNVESGAVGNGGNINITTGKLFLTNDARLSASTFGQGDAGKVFIEASDAVFLTGSGTTIFDNIENEGVGNSGGIFIKAGSLSLTDGAQLQSGIRGTNGTLLGGRGNAGGVNIDVRDSVTLAGIAKNGLASAIFGDVEFGAVGKGGDINITAGSLSLTNGARLVTSTSGQGDAGRVFIQTSDAVSLADSGTGIFSNVGAGAVGNGGDINIKARSLELSDGAQLNASSSGQGDAGNVAIVARDTVSFDGVGSNGFPTGAFSLLSTGAVGKGGGINITTGSLFLTNGASLISSTFGKGDAGNISVRANNAVSLESGSSIRGVVESGGQGKGADIDISASSLSVTNGSQVLAALFRPQGTIPGGQGRGGNIQVNVSDSVNLSGIGSTGFSSGLLTLADRGTSGPAGSITVNTGNFRVADGAVVAAGTDNSSDAGNITISAKTFEAVNGGQILTNTRSSGNAGTIRLNVEDSITLTGSDPNFATRLAQIQQRLQAPGQTDEVSDVVANQGPASGLFANTDPGSTGRGGSIIVDPRTVIIRDGAGISVNSQGTGIGGSIQLQADSLILDKNAFLSADTASNTGGNITLQIGDLLLLRHGSLISTNAGTIQAGGDGGNITIATPFIVAVPQENSDITANAYTGKGGNIQITTQGIFGTQYRPHLTPLSDITASSQFGVNGTVQINTPGVDPSRGLTDLATAPVDASKQIAQNCPARGTRQGSSFIITGTGGLPPRPEDPFTSPYPTGIVRGIPSSASSDPATNPASSADTSNPDHPPATPTIEEAQGWVYGPHGEVILTATAPTLTPQNAGLKPDTCPRS